MQRFFDFFNKYLFGPSLPFVIIVLGGFLFIKYGGFIIFRPRQVISVLTRKNTEEGISPFKTAMLALASTLGVGNIVGVSTAIFSGGPGAVFWMTVSAFAAMPLKYGEVVLAMKYRRKEGGEYRGGAMYYIKDCLKKRELSVLFAFLCIVNSFTVGNIVQIKAFTDSFTGVFGGRAFYIGMIAAAVILFSVSRGTERITSITSKIIPSATLAYIGISVYIICVNHTQIIPVIRLIFKEAFSIRAAVGGIGGYTLMKAMRFGAARGIMSNEAGSGTSPTAHAKSNLKSPVEQGFWGIFEVFADTVLMCNLTAFVILLSFDEYVLKSGLDGMELVLASYGKYIGGKTDVVIAVAVMLFAYSTVICQCFYGMESVYYLTKKRAALTLYKLMFCSFVIYGAVGRSEMIWSLTDFNISLMTVINTVCIFMLSGIIKKETDSYFLKRPNAEKKTKNSPA